MKKELLKIWKEFNKDQDRRQELFDEDWPKEIAYLRPLADKVGVLADALFFEGIEVSKERLAKKHKIVERNITNALEWKYEIGKFGRSLKTNA